MEPVFPWSMSDFKPGEGILCAEEAVRLRAPAQRVCVAVTCELWPAYAVSTLTPTPGLAECERRFFHGAKRNTRLSVWFVSPAKQKLLRRRF